VLYLDGEMSIQDMRYRARQLNMGQNCKQPVYLYSDAYANNLGLPRANLLNENWRKEMKSILIGKGIKLWIVDNIASLAPGINENVKDEWDPINEYLLTLRFAGIASILLHHVGKAGGQRGTSAREDNIDTSIILKQPDDYETEDGCRFVMSFKKNRVICGDHFLLADQEFQYADGQWTWVNAKTKTKSQIIDMLNNGYKNKDIAATLGVSAAYVSKVKKDSELS
jgi:putative DNA primase/helicase